MDGCDGWTDTAKKTRLTRTEIELAEHGEPGVVVLQLAELLKDVLVFFGGEGRRVLGLGEMGPPLLSAGEGGEGGRRGQESV